MNRIAEISKQAITAIYAVLCLIKAGQMTAIMAIILLLFMPDRIALAADQDQIGQRSRSFLPILMYDSDIGLGFGIKSVWKNYLRCQESSDLLVFSSTKGEQDYALSFSFPDDEIRQGRIYPLAFDARIEYDKVLKSNFFGFGNGSENNEFQFPRESFSLWLAVSRALDKAIAIGINSRYAHYTAYGYNLDWQTINAVTPGAGRIDFITLKAFIHYDTRNSILNPNGGLKAELSIERELPVINTDYDFTKFRYEIGFYHKIISPAHILASRFWIQHVAGRAPYQELSKIGDSWTARGYKADRFLDKAMALISIEYRFPIYKKLGGVTFVDDGRVWPGMDKFCLKDWHSDFGIGLRLYLKNFVARLDIGHSHESTRIFFNFDQVF